MSNQYQHFEPSYQHQCCKCGIAFMSNGGGSRCCQTCSRKTCPVCGGGYWSRANTCSRICGNKIAANKRTGPRPEDWKQSMRVAQQKRAASPRGKELAAMHSARMTQNNPMRFQAVIQKMMETKSANGTLRPVKPWQGGNGRGPTTQQAAIQAAFPGSIMELAIRTAMLGPRKTTGYPHAYKADIAFPDIKLAIEIDGSTHRSAEGRVLDQKKDQCLQQLGWRVLRISNRQISRDFDKAVKRIKSVIRSMRTSMILQSTGTHPSQSKDA